MDALDCVATSQSHGAMVSSLGVRRSFCSCWCIIRGDWSITDGWPGRVVAESFLSRKSGCTYDWICSWEFSSHDSMKGIGFFFMFVLRKILEIMKFSSRLNYGEHFPRLIACPPFGSFCGGRFVVAVSWRLGSY